jgi:hypothetical protein
MNAGIESGGNGLVERVKGIILKPTEEWPKIEGETKGLGEILTGYVLPLAAIGPVAAFIGGQIGLVTVLRRSPERLELAAGDRRDDQAFRRVQAGGGAHCADQWSAA